MSTQRPRSLVAVAIAMVALATVAGASTGCVNIASDGSMPASIEFARLAAPAIAVGDSLRDTLGIARPLRAIVRDVRGDVLDEIPVRYLSRDTAVVIDSVTGHIVARTRPASGTARVAARFETQLQIEAPVRITIGPDTVFRTDSARLDSLLVEGTPGAAAANRVPIAIRVAWRDNAGALQGAGDWLVRFTIRHPANPRNDSTAGVFLLDDQGRPGRLGTSSATGAAGRLLQVRPSLFPAGGAREDTVEVDALVVGRDGPVAGSPVRIRVPVRRD